MQCCNQRYFAFFLWNHISFFQIYVFFRQIEIPIEIISGLTDKTCIEKKDTRFDLKLNKPGLSNHLVWLKDGNELDFSNSDVNQHYSLQVEKNTYSLVIKSCSYECSGEYSVKISKQDIVSRAALIVEGKSLTTLLLSQAFTLFFLFSCLKEPPVEIIQSLNNVNCKEDEAFSLECELNKIDKNAKWSFNGKSIDENNKDFSLERVDKVYRLRVLKADLDRHGGRFTFQTSETSVSSSCVVEIGGVHQSMCKLRI
jgi:hypothetical protein